MDPDINSAPQHARTNERRKMNVLPGSLVRKVKAFPTNAVVRTRVNGNHRTAQRVCWKKQQQQQKPTHGRRGAVSWSLGKASEHSRPTGCSAGMLDIKIENENALLESAWPRAPLLQRPQLEELRELRYDTSAREFGEWCEMENGRTLTCCGNRVVRTANTRENGPREPRRKRRKTENHVEHSAEMPPSESSLFPIPDSCCDSAAILVGRVCLFDI